MRGTKPILRAIEGGLSDMPPAPAWLHPLAKGEWNRVVPGLVERSVLAESDFGTLESYCVAIGQIRQCEALLQSEEMFVQSDRSALRPHPAFRIMHCADVGPAACHRTRADSRQPQQAGEGGGGQSRRRRGLGR